MVCTDEIIKESFILNIDNIALLWLRVWGTLNENEKELIILFVENGKMDWSTLIKKISYSNVTLTKYLDLLTNKGIITYSSDGNYYLSDLMLKRWLELKCDKRGRYPQ